jgi:DNA-directed RNA polymerase specialized sigma24 family protein
LGSITKLISRVKAGDAAAAQELFARYCRRLAGLARARLQGKCLAAVDEDDVVQSALAGFFLGATHGQYTKLHDRDDLWHLLVKITVRKVKKFVKYAEAQKRHGVPDRGDCAKVEDGAAEQVADPNLPPDLEVLARDEIQQLLNRLGNAELRSIAVWKWENYSNEEIAMMLGCTARTVQRKLKLIRTIWGEEDIA